jgi:hypothetical protein
LNRKIDFDECELMNSIALKKNWEYAVWYEWGISYDFVEEIIKSWTKNYKENVLKKRYEWKDEIWSCKELLREYLEDDKVTMFDEELHEWECIALVYFKTNYWWDIIEWKCVKDLKDWYWKLRNWFIQIRLWDLKWDFLIDDLM